MKAVLFTEYGPPESLRLGEVEVPRPGRGEILIRVRATTVTRAECMMRRGDSAMARLVLGLRRPRKRYRVMGSELAGEVAEVGGGVARFKAGDRVYGFTGFRQGAHAEYARVAEKASIAAIPAGVGFEEAASLADGATTASFFLRAGRGLGRDLRHPRGQLLRRLQAVARARRDIPEDDGRPGGPRPQRLDRRLRRQAGDLRHVDRQAGEPGLPERPAVPKGIKSVIDRRYALGDIAEAFAYVETGRKRGDVVVAP